MDVHGYQGRDALSTPDLKEAAERLAQDEQCGAWERGRLGACDAHGKLIGYVSFTWNDIQAVLAALASKDEEIKRLRETLERIAKTTPAHVAGGFVQGPRVLWLWAQRTARQALQGGADVSR